MSSTSLYSLCLTTVIVQNFISSLNHKTLDECFQLSFISSDYLIDEEKAAPVGIATVIRKNKMHCVMGQTSKTKAVIRLVLLSFQEEEISMLGEITHLQTISDDLKSLTMDPHKLPSSSEQVSVEDVLIFSF